MDANDGWQMVGRWLAGGWQDGWQVGWQMVGRWLAVGWQVGWLAVLASESCSLKKYI